MEDYASVLASVACETLWATAVTWLLVDMHKQCESTIRCTRLARAEVSLLHDSLRVHAPAKGMNNEKAYMAKGRLLYVRNRIQHQHCHE